MSFYGLDMTQEEALADLEKVKKSGSRDGRVCVCGHGLGYHAFIDGRGVYKCNAQKQTCPCKNPRPVLTTDNVKAFYSRHTEVLVYTLWVKVLLTLANLITQSSGLLIWYATDVGQKMLSLVQ